MYLEQEWVELPNSNCWNECHERGGQCAACESQDSDALAGYCCSGANHLGGDGAVLNGDCPANAVAAVNSNVHACVFLKENAFQPVPPNGKVPSIRPGLKR